MAVGTPHIDPYLFDRQFEAFTKFVEERSGVAFVSFASNPYTERQEGYKSEIYRVARIALAFQEWKPSDIGSGRISKSVIAAIEISNNNLVPWQARFGENSRPHHALFEADHEPDRMQVIEKCFFKLYREECDAQAFTELVDVLGKSYSLLAYLFFLKDRSKYLPIATTYFDDSFETLGAQFKTTKQCSWDNYLTYLTLIGELKGMLVERLSVEVTLLDAHSFAWMLTRQLKQENRLADVQDYLNLSSTEREAIVKARIGQGRFRDSLIEYWSTCAVTGCAEPALLLASHIKPWAIATLVERLSLYNGLLLSPTLDACFDSGFVSFDDDGKILISGRLTAQDASALNIHSNMELRRVEPEHRKYLAFHRKHVFK